MATAKARLLGCKPDIIHILDGSHAYIAKWFPRIPVVATSHDIIPILQAQGCLGNFRPSPAGTWLMQRSLEGIKSVDVIVADSKNTASDLLRFAGVQPERIRVIHLGLSKNISEGAACNPIASWHERRTREDAYIFHVGNNAFYKNRTGVVRVFSYVLEKLKIRLVMAGPEPTKELLSMVEERGLSGAVEFVADPDETALDNLYRNACLFLFPSLYEGFGWPPLEAMTYRCPVVCSDAASLPEVVGDAALICSSADEVQTAEKCINVLQDERLANDLIARGLKQTGKFTLEKMGRELIGVYRDVINARSC
jgi:glycosyltransferase involved in cell wall biosynthesis